MYQVHRYKNVLYIVQKKKKKNREEQCLYNRVHKFTTTTSPAMVNRDACMNEWIKAKMTVKQQDYKTGSIQCVMEMLQRHHSNDYPNLLKLAAFAITCPLQTADCERGFSVQNRILTPLRNRLSIDTQNKLMSVKLGSVDLAQALTKWKETPRLLYGQSNRT